MKKYYLLAAAVMLICLAGCGDKPAPEPAATPTPEPTVTQAPKPEEESELVEMQVTAKKEKQTPEEEVQYEAGPKDDSEGQIRSLIVENQTGNPISEFYLRVHPDEDEDEEDEWETDIIGSSFIMANGEKMRCSFYRNNASTLYDIRVGYSNEDLSECFFRSLPLEKITKIVLRMEGRGQDSIPYATYLEEGNTKEYSTLNDVRRRLGLLENDLDALSDEDDVMQSDDSYEPEPEPEHVEREESIEDTNTAEAAQPQTESAPTETPADIDTGEIIGDSEAETDTMKTARGYIGQSLDALQGAIGSGNASDYEEFPNVGMTGYHYYGSFTVSTAVDENGNEIVTGVW